MLSPPTADLGARHDRRKKLRGRQRRPAPTPRSEASAMAAESGELTGLALSGVDLSDDEGCVLMDAFAEIAPSSAREQPAIGTKLTAAAGGGTTPVRRPNASGGVAMSRTGAGCAR